MRRLMWAWLCCAVILAAPPALALEGAAGRVLVYVEECAHLTVENNGQWVRPGEDAAFLLAVDLGYAVGRVEYDGEFALEETPDGAVLTVRRVSYPTRVRVALERLDDRDMARLRNFRTIVYDPNDGASEPFEETYGILEHPRPNTCNGASLRRAGYTLTGWNTARDGSGLAVGLGSRVTVPREGLTLYGQWARWTDDKAFSWEIGESGATVTGYTGNADPIVIPAEWDGAPVAAIASGAFRDCGAARVVFPPTLRTIGDGAFADAALREITVFDSIREISDAAFRGCADLQTLRVNAALDPYGYRYRRESLLADKADLLILAAGRPKMIFYGGCNVWYNLIGGEAARRFPAFRVVNMGLNGTVNSLLQMQIIRALAEPGDIFFHSPEISSPRQLLLDTALDAGDDMLWAGLEYNYDLLAYADLRALPGALDSWRHYLSIKQPGGSYQDVYRDASGNAYLDETGGIPLIRTQGRTRLEDAVTLDPGVFSDGLQGLGDEWGLLAKKGVSVYVSWACLDTDALTAAEKALVPEIDARFHQAVAAMEGPVMISDLADYLYTARDFYDTHYHLLTPQAYQNTGRWLDDIEAQLSREGRSGAP